MSLNQNLILYFDFSRQLREFISYLIHELYDHLKKELCKMSSAEDTFSNGVSSGERCWATTHITTSFELQYVAFGQTSIITMKQWQYYSKRASNAKKKKERKSKKGTYVRTPWSPFLVATMTESTWNSSIFFVAT